MNKSENALESNNGKSSKTKWLSLIIILVAVFMDLLDSTIVGLAIPVIQKDIGTSITLMQWVTAAYSLTLSTFLIVGGRLGDIFGRKRIFLIGMAGFILASVMCGMAQNSLMLIVTRAVQGGMSALMIPQVLSMIHLLFAPEERGAAFGLYGGITGLATVSGPLAGAFIIQANIFNLGWRMIFLINLPIGIIALIFAAMHLKESKSANAKRLDTLGMIIITIGLLLFVYPLIQGQVYGWPIWSIIMIILSFPVFIVFALYERNVNAKTGSPLVVTGLFKQKTFVAGLVVNLFLYLAISAFFFTYGIYWQIGLGFSVISAGLTSLAWSISVILISGVSTKYVMKLGKKLIQIGVCFLIVTIVGFIVTIFIVGSEIVPANVIPFFITGGLGMGLIAPIMTNIILMGVKSDDVGSASGIINTVSQMGNGIGVALVGIIFFGLLTSQVNIYAQKAVPEIRTELKTIGIDRELQDDIIEDFKVSFAKSLFEAEEKSSVSCFNLLETAKSNNRISSEIEDDVIQVVKNRISDNRERLFNLSFTSALVSILIVLLISLVLSTLLPKKSIES
jgi:EmrB/QacA subfamily drug resistance transporter